MVVRVAALGLEAGHLRGRRLDRLRGGGHLALRQHERGRALLERHLEGPRVDDEQQIALAHLLVVDDVAAP